MDWIGMDSKGREEEGREGNRLKGRRWNVVEFDFAVMSGVKSVRETLKSQSFMRLWHQTEAGISGREQGKGRWREQH